MNKITIEKLVPGGQGIGVDENGKKGFFWNALPGEIVSEYRITKNKSHYFEAIAEEIENPSNHRIAPKDACFLSTSPWQIMDYDFELEQKTLLLEEQFNQFGIELFGISATFVERDDRESARNDGPDDRCPKSLIQTDHNDFFYRNKMEYALYWDNGQGKIFLAFHERGSHRKIPIENSSIERPELFKKAQKIVDDLNARHEEARKYQSLLLRCNKNGEVSGGLYENKKPHPTFKNLTDEILGNAYSYSPNGFFQINLPVYEMALLEIKKHIKTKKVLDLYAGVGTIGLSVASDKDLTLVECNKFAYAELEENCASTFFEDTLATTGASAKAAPVTNQKSEETRACSVSPNDVDSGPKGQTGCGLSGVREKRPRAILDQSENALDYIAPDQTVIVDPPRAGCDKKLLNKLIEILPEAIIYLSCNPATQARDVKILLDSKKYKIVSATPFNFFPRTPHLENLIILEKI